MANKPVALAPTAAGPLLTFRDTRYTSRTLILPDARELPVARGLVTVDADDDGALEYLNKHPDMQRVE